MKHSITLLMAAHLAALQSKVAAAGAYEKREEPSIKSVAEALDKIAGTFDQYKKTNDERLDALKAGKATGDLEAKLAKIEQNMDGLAEAKSRLEKMELKLARPGALDGGPGRRDGETTEEAEYRSAFVEWVRNPRDAERESRCVAAGKALEAKSMEGKSTQVVTSNNTSGGFALPKVVEQSIARLGLDISPIRSLATVRTVGSVDYTELFDLGGAGFEWIGETDTRNQTNTPDLKDIKPTFGMASAKPQATEESLDDLFFNVEDWLISSAAEAMAQGEAVAFVSGNGTKKPTGFLAGPTPVATADAGRAFGTLQFIASGQASALPASADVFVDIVHSLRARYRANARWVCNKMVLGALRKYKDTQGQYLWQPSLQADVPSSFLGYPVVEAEDIPNVAANAFPVAFGDFREGYLIADRVGMRMTRDEITTPGFVKFYVRKRVGGILRNTQAIKLLKVATS